jgi:hypothetical protein
MAQKSRVEVPFEEPYQIASRLSRTTERSCPDPREIWTRSRESELWTCQKHTLRLQKSKGNIFSRLSPTRTVRLDADLPPSCFVHEIIEDNLTPPLYVTPSAGSSANAAATAGMSWVRARCNSTIRKRACRQRSPLHDRNYAQQQKQHIHVHASSKRSCISQTDVSIRVTAIVFTLDEHAYGKSMDIQELMRPHCRSKTLMP